MYIAILVLFSYDLTQHLFSPPPLPPMQTIYPKNNVFEEHGDMDVDMTTG